LKRISFNLDERQVKLLFSPIREKTDVIKLLMESIKIMLVNNEMKENLIKGRMLLHVSKMSRLFYFSDNKYFSINFPFFINQEDTLFFYSKNLKDIDSRITSDVLGILSSEKNLIASSSMYDLLELASETEDDEDYRNIFLSFLNELLLFEDGYIRYDYDEKRTNELTHPLNHLDIFYSSGSTFKIGLTKRISEDFLIDLLDLQTVCHFLTPKLK
jgi:hypothetical protein